MDGVVDFTIAQYTITALRNKYMSPSFPYTSMPFVLMVPPGKKYTAFEKLFRPFDLSVWIPIIIVFIVATISITIIKLSSKTIRNIFFGPKIQSPYLNVLTVFVEGSIHVIPTKSFARSLLLIFIIYSLIMRTLYQGGLIKNMQSDDRKPSLSSVDAMINKHFKFYVTTTEMEHVEHLSIKNRYNEVLNSIN